MMKKITLALLVLFSFNNSYVGQWFEEEFDSKYLPVTPVNLSVMAHRRAATTLQFAFRASGEIPIRDKIHLEYAFSTGVVTDDNAIWAYSDSRSDNEVIPFYKYDVIPSLAVLNYVDETDSYIDIERYSIRLGYTNYGGSFYNYMGPDYGSSMSLESVDGVYFPGSANGRDLNFHTNMDAKLLRVGVSSDLIEIDKTSDYSSPFKQWTFYADTYFPINIEMEDILIKNPIETYSSYDTTMYILPGKYDVLHEERSNVGGFYNWSKIGVCLGMKYQAFREGLFGIVFFAEGGIRPSALYNIDGYTRLPFYIELGFGLSPRIPRK